MEETNLKKKGEKKKKKKEEENQRDVSYLRRSITTNLVLKQLLHLPVLIATDHRHHLSTSTRFIYPPL